MFAPLAGETVNVTEGVIINAGGGGQYATFTGFRPFSFTHDAKGAAGAGLASAITGGVFDGCGVPVGNNFGFDDCGGAIQVMNGTLTVANTRFTGNTAFSGGAIAVDTGAKLVVRGLPNVNPPLPGPGEPFIPELLETRTLFKGNGAVAAGRGGGDLEFGGGGPRRRVVRRELGQRRRGDRHHRFGEVDRPRPGSARADADRPAGPIVYDVRFYENTARRDGGAVFYRSSNQTSVLDHVAFGSNSAAARGGGSAVLQGTLSLTESTFGANQATAFGPNGAGIHIEGAANWNTKVVATRVKFDNNNGLGGFGVFIASWGEFQSHGCDFSNNNMVWIGRTPVAPGQPLNPLGTYTPDPNDPDINMM